MTYEVYEARIWFDLEQNGSTTQRPDPVVQYVVREQYGDIIAKCGTHAHAQMIVDALNATN